MASLIGLPRHFADTDWLKTPSPPALGPSHMSLTASLESDESDQNLASIAVERLLSSSLMSPPRDNGYYDHFESEGVFSRSWVRV